MGSLNDLGEVTQILWAPEAFFNACGIALLNSKGLQSIYVNFLHLGQTNFVLLQSILCTEFDHWDHNAYFLWVIYMCPLN